MESNQQWKTKTIILGALLGALAGIFSAYVFIQRAQENNPKLSAGDGVKVGIGILSVVKSIADLAARR